MELKSGTYLQGDKYRIERSLGQGGFGITYLAEHELAGRMVCIKEFFPKSFYNRDADSSHVSLGSQGSAEMMDAYKQKFLKEARTIARLDHQNIIHIHDVFQENGTAYYVMEYIEGESLQDIVRRRGALPTDEALALMNPVIDAVGYIHDRRIMHLDIKPGNIMVRKEDGRPILIDFGLSKQYDEEGNQTSSTPVGISHGFAPIEQYQMGGVSAFSPQTDIYSLGATLYYLVSGTVPPQAAIVANEGMPELPATISTNVRTAIEKAMEFRSKQRPESIAKLKQLLGSNATATVSVSTSAQPSADTVIDIVADNSATQIDGGATQIDVPKDDATQIDGGSETAIEPKPQPEPKVAPKPEPKVSPKPESKSVSTPKPTEPKKKSKWWLWLLLALVAVGGGIVISNSLNNSISEPTDYHNGYGYVDLGLSVKWATRNVGAGRPSDYGLYYAWGQTSSSDDLSIYSTMEQTIGDIAGTSRDAAMVNWGGRWRMPTCEEFGELIEECDWKWTTQNGHNGYMVTGPNGNSIFLPAAGLSFQSTDYVDTYGYYWSSTPHESYTQAAYSLGLDSGDHSMDWNIRYNGFSVRPVLD